MQGRRGLEQTEASSFTLEDQHHLESQDVKCDLSGRESRKIAGRLNTEDEEREENTTRRNKSGCTTVVRRHPKQYGGDQLNQTFLVVYIT